jgi:hypothetical protein
MSDKIKARGERLMGKGGLKFKEFRVEFGYLFTAESMESAEMTKKDDK